MGIQDTRYKIQDTRYKIQDTSYKIQDTIYNTQDRGLQDTRLAREEVEETYGQAGSNMLTRYEIQKRNNFNNIKGQKLFAT